MEVVSTRLVVGKISILYTFHCLEYLAVGELN